MSWQDYVDKQLMASRCVTKAAIAGHDGNVWAKSEAFEVSFSSVKLLLRYQWFAKFKSCCEYQCLLVLSSVVRIRFDGWRILYPASLTRWRHVVEPGIRIRIVICAEMKWYCIKVITLYSVEFLLLLSCWWIGYFSLYLAKAETTGRCIVRVSSINLDANPSHLFCQRNVSKFILFRILELLLILIIIMTTCCRIKPINCSNFEALTYSLV